MIEEAMSNKELYNSFLSEPMKGAIIGITKWRFRVWFKNDKKIWINKSKRYSHKQLMLGDVEEFQVLHIDEKLRYVLYITNKNNSLIPYEDRKKSENKKKQKKILMRDIPFGIHIVEILYLDDKRTSMKMQDNEIKISTPLLFKKEPPPLNTKIRILIVHKTTNIENGKTRVFGRIDKWSLD
jgi:hypothetical protein